MKLHNQYLSLHARYGGAGDGESTVTLQELADTLDCTHRSAVTVVAKMARLGWIDWTAQRGRGRRSLLRFLVNPEEIAVLSMMQAMNRRENRRGMDRFHAHTGPSTVQDRLEDWLAGYFGHHSETRSDKQVDTLRLPIRHPLHTVDPLSINLLAESFVASHVFDGLVRRASGSHDILPGIAHAWEADSDRTRWTFHLRKEVPFHNGGTLTAEDVVYSLQRLVQSTRRTLYSFIFKQIRTVRALNANTVSIELEEPNELFLPFLCTSRAAIVPKDLGRMPEDVFGRKPVGTGPFQVTEMNDSLCTLDAFSPYFQGRAHLDRVEIVHVPWEAEAEAEASDGLSPFHLIHNAASAEQSWSRIRSETSIRKFITCNTKKTGPLTDPAFRARVMACLGDTADAGRTLVSDGLTAPLQITTIAQYEKDAELVAAKLGISGYVCTIVSVPPEEFKGPIRLESDLILFSLIRDRDEQLRLFDLYLTIADHALPHTGTDIGKWLRAVKREPDPYERAGLFAKIEELLVREHQLQILYENPVQTAYLPSVRGVTFNSQGWVDLRSVWFPPVLSN